MAWSLATRCRWSPCPPGDAPGKAEDTRPVAPLLGEVKLEAVSHEARRAELDRTAGGGGRPAKLLIVLREPQPELPIPARLRNDQLPGS